MQSSSLALVSRVTKETTCVEESIAGSGTRAEPLEAATESVAAAKRRQLFSVAKSSPTAAKLGCAFSHSAERIVDELGLLYPENRGNLRKNMASV